MTLWKPGIDLNLDAFAHFEDLAKAVLVTEAQLDTPGPRILYANPAFEQMTGWSRAKIVGRTPRVLQGPKTDRSLMRELKMTLKRGAAWSGETVNYRRDGRPFIMKWTIAPVRDAAGVVQRFVATQEDVTEVRERQRREAHLNGLTRRLMAVASEGIVVLNADQRITAIGAGAAEIFGWQENELIDQPVSVLIPERFRAAHSDHVQDFGGADEDVRPMARRSEVCALHRDGYEIPVMVTIAKLNDSDGGGFVAVVRDLTVRKTQARKLAESERRYQALFNLTYQFVGLLSPDGRILEANQTALAFIDAQIADIYDMHFLDTPWLAGNEGAQAVARPALAAAASGESVHGQIVLEARDGDRRTFDFSLRPVFGTDGSVEYLIPEGHDITELMRSKEVLKTREKQLNEAQRIARVGDWHWDIPSGRLFWSAEIYRIFGLDPSGEASYEQFLQMVHPDDRAGLEAAVAAALSGEAAYSMDHRIIRPDGTQRVLHEEGEVRFAADGTATGMVGTVQDVSERKALEAELVNAKCDAETANEAKSRFLSTMGHELRTPLNAINGFSQMIRDEAFGPVGAPQYREYAGFINQSGEHLLDVLNTILDATRVESGRLELDADGFAAENFLRQTVDLARAERPDPSVKIVLESVPAVELLADRRLLRQALLNLIGNAAKFTPKDGVVTVEAELERTGILEIRVRDNGPGIPADAIHRVTLPFVQADDTLSRRHEGSGLGLYLAKTFMILHGGDLELTCPDGGGTIATIKLPASRVGSEEASVNQ